MQGGHHGEGELVGIGVGSEVASVTHEREAVAKELFPAVKPCGEVGACGVVALRQLSGERAVAAASLAVVLLEALDVELRPPLQHFEAVQLAKLGHLVDLDDGLALMGDDRWSAACREVPPMIAAKTSSASSTSR